ncbi:MAG: sensor histidine kinase, partial [Ferruginibacter sp.]
GNYEQAARYFYESIGLLENSNQKKNLAFSYNGLAKLYRKTRILDRSLINYNKALEIFIQLKDSSGISMIQNESGVVFEYQGNYQEAIKRYSISYNIAVSLKDSLGISYALSNLAGVYDLQLKFSEAEGFLKRSLELRKHLNDSLALGLVYQDIANNYYSQKLYGKARLYTDSSNYIAFLMDYRELKSQNFKILANISKETGDFKEAFSFLEKRTTLNDSLFNNEKFKQIEALNNKYETLKTEKVIQQQKFEIKKRNYWMLAGVLFLLLLSLAAFSYYKREQLQQRSRLQQTILSQQKIATAAVINAEEKERQRIAKDLHDGIGQMMSAAKMNLSALENKLVFKNEKERLSYGKIMIMLDESCRELRSVSHNMMPNALLKNNLEEALITFSSQLNHPELKIALYTEGLGTKLDTNTETVLYRVIQEAVNNVIKHAGATKVDIAVINDKDGLSVTIEDNGRGFDSQPGFYSDGIGMTNMRSRVYFLKGTVEFISSAGAGTLVSLHIPKNTD